MESLSQKSKKSKKQEWLFLLVILFWFWPGMLIISIAAFDFAYRAEFIYHRWTAFHIISTIICLIWGSITLMTGLMAWPAIYKFFSKSNE